MRKRRNGMPYFAYGAFRTNAYCRQDCLKKHIQRAAYQTFIWKRCLVNFVAPPSPVGNGWELISVDLTIHWMSNNVAPDQLPKFLNCGCKKGCKTQICYSFEPGLRCTELCKCQSCTKISSDTVSDCEQR